MKQGIQGQTGAQRQGDFKDNSSEQCCLQSDNKSPITVGY
jgi:hypothetical protein